MSSWKQMKGLVCRLSRHRGIEHRYGLQEGVLLLLTLPLAQIETFGMR